LSIEKWERRYRDGEKLREEPSPLVVEFTRDLPPGAALDLACGPGRHALYLAARGWQVTAVDGAPAAVELLRRFSRESDLAVDTRLADLDAQEFDFPDGAFDLVLSCLYLQRNLIPKMKRTLRREGIVIMTALLGEAATPTRVAPGELRSLFDDWRVWRSQENQGVAEIVAQRPG
jgi:SAM-dependent methyltransferase